MQITFSANNNEEIIKIPYVPPDISISQTQKNEEFETISSGTINLIGNMGLRTLNLSSFFPTQAYNWVRKDAALGWTCVEFFKKWRAKKVPIRISIMDGDRTIINMACSVDSFTYSVSRNKNIKYRLSIKEYVI